MLSMTTDYARDTGSPAPYLKHIADAGFSHVHWCHHWNTDFIYSRPEVDQIGRWLAEYGLRLLDLHASVGPEKNWASPAEYERLAGVELVANRIEMAARLGADVIIMHTGQPDPADPDPFWRQLGKSLDALEPIARAHGVRIAVENGDWAVIRRVLAEQTPGFVGLCYDAGHGNVDGRGLAELETLGDRLISVHLHDNDGASDQHKLPFTGTVDWPRLARILARSAYAKPPNLEVLMANTGIPDEDVFLGRAFETGMHLSRMIREVAAA